MSPASQTPSGRAASAVTTAAASSRGTTRRRIFAGSESFASDTVSLRPSEGRLTVPGTSNSVVKVVCTSIGASALGSSAILRVSAAGAAARRLYESSDTAPTLGLYNDNIHGRGSVACGESRGWPVESVSLTFDQSSPVVLEIAPWRSSDTFDPAESSPARYAGRHPAPFTW